MPTKTKLPSMMFGNCTNGWHEAPGGKYKEGERPLPACKGRIEYRVGPRVQFYHCGCGCHEKITLMFEESGLDRVWPEIDWRSEADRLAFRATQPEFDSEFLREWRESKFPVDLPANANEPAPSLEDFHEAVEQADPDAKSKMSLASILPPNPEQPPEWTPGQPRPRGMLEFQVKITCDGWVLGAYPHLKILKPLDIARLIDAESPPSTGAITNILVAWKEIAFANIQTEVPRCFLGYTQAGIQYGIAALRERHSKVQGSARSSLKTRMLRGDRHGS